VTESRWELPTSSTQSDATGEDTAAENDNTDAAPASKKKKATEQVQLNQSNLISVVNISC